MGLDIRIPIGLLFGIIGLILVLAGLISNDEIYRSSLGVNVNLWWGLVMLVFGVVMIFLASEAEMLPQSEPTMRVV